MPVIITGDDLKKLNDAEKGREVINILSELNAAQSMVTLCVVLSSLLPVVCDNQQDAAFTLDELVRLMKDLTAKVYEARASGELKIDPMWDDEVWGD